VEIPPLNHPVVIRTADGREHSSRSEGVEDGALVLATPFGLTADPEAWLGTEVVACWTAASGLCELTVTIAGSGLSGPVRVWHTRPSTPSTRTRHYNRRAHVRVPVQGLVTVEHDGSSHRGTMLDASEAGLRCKLERSKIPDEAEVTASFVVGDRPFELPGMVYRILEKDRGAELAIALDADPRDADELRRAVFAEQIKQRQRQRLE